MGSRNELSTQPDGDRSTVKQTEYMGKTLSRTAQLVEVDSANKKKKHALQVQRRPRTHNPTSAKHSSAAICSTGGLTIRAAAVDRVEECRMQSAEVVQTSLQASTPRV